MAGVPQGVLGNTQKLLFPTNFVSQIRSNRIRLGTGPGGLSLISFWVDGIKEELRNVGDTSGAESGPDYPATSQSTCAPES